MRTLSIALGAGLRSFSCHLLLSRLVLLHAVELALSLTYKFKRPFHPIFSLHCSASYPFRTQCRNLSQPVSLSVEYHRALSPCPRPPFRRKGIPATFCTQRKAPAYQSDSL